MQDQDAATILALEALEWLAGNDELLPVFLGATGAGMDDLRSRVADPEFLISVLDFVLLDDAWVIAFASDTARAPDEAMSARQALAGPADMHWT